MDVEPKADFELDGHRKPEITSKIMVGADKAATEPTAGESIAAIMSVYEKAGAVSADIHSDCESVDEASDEMAVELDTVSNQKQDNNDNVMMDRMMKILDKLPDCSLEKFWAELYTDYTKDRDEAVQVSDITGKEEPSPDPGAEDTSDLTGHQDAYSLERASRPHLSRPHDSSEQQNNNVLDFISFICYNAITAHN